VSWRRAALAAALLLSSSAAARAVEQTPPLALALTGCERYDEARLRELVSIEMGTIAARGAAPAGATADVRVACAGDGATIALAPGAGVRATQSQLDLSAAEPATRERLLALAITEVVAQGWAAPPAPAPVAPPPAAVVAQPAPAVEPASFGVFAGTSARLMASPATWLAGVDVGVARAVSRWAAVVLDARGEAGEGDTAIARVGWRQLTVTGALALGVTRSRWAAHLAPGWSVGWAWLTGRPEAPAAGAGVSGAWSGPSLTLRARRDVGQRAFVALELASGYVTRRLVGLVNDERPIFEVRGAWALAGLAVGLTF
jgi:hypothetical protein